MAPRSTTAERLGRRFSPLACMLVAAVTLVACEKPKPRTFIDFLEDPIARESALLRCNLDRDATADDPECENARRAAVAIAARQDEARQRELELESQRKREALRAQAAAEQERARIAEEAARAAAQAAYEAQWSDPAAAGTQPAAPTNAAPAAIVPDAGAAPDSTAQRAETPARESDTSAGVTVPSIPRPFRETDPPPQ